MTDKKQDNRLFDFFGWYAAKRFLIILVYLNVCVIVLGSIFSEDMYAASARNPKEVSLAERNFFALKDSASINVYLPVIIYNPFLPAGCVTGNNNTFESVLGILQMGLDYCGFLDDAYDYYSFKIQQDANVRVSLENQGYPFPHEPTWPPNNQIFLYDKNQNLISYCCDNAKFDLNLEKDLTSGQYYVLVYSRTIKPDIRYILKVSEN